MADTRRNNVASLPPELMSHILNKFGSLPLLHMLKLTSRGFFNPLNENKIWQERTRVHFPHVYARYTHPDAGSDWKHRFCQIYEQEYAGLDERTRKLLTIVKEGNVDLLKPLDETQPTTNKPQIALSFADLSRITDNAKNDLFYWAIENKCQKMLDYFYKLAKRQYTDEQTGALLPAEFMAHKVMYDKTYYPTSYLQPVTETLDIARAIKVTKPDIEGDDFDIYRQSGFLHFLWASLKQAIINNNSDEDCLLVLRELSAEYPDVEQTIEEQTIQEIVEAICVTGKLKLLESVWEIYRYKVDSLKWINPLSKAIEANKLEIVKFLIEKIEQKGIDINDGYPGLLNFAITCQHTGIIDYLLQLPNIDLNAVNTDWFTALHYAAEYDQVNTVISLLEKGVNINAMSRSGVKPVKLTKNEQIRNILWLFECLHKLNMTASSDSKAEFKLLNQSFRLRLKDIHAFYILSQVILDKEKPEALEPFQDTYAQYPDLTEILANIAKKQSITKKYAARECIVRQNRFVFIDTIEDLLRIIKISIDSIRYDIYGEKGAGLYLSLRVTNPHNTNSKLKHNVYYLEDENTNIEHLINEMVTDIFFLYMFEKSSLDRMVIYGPNYDTSHSYSHDSLHGYTGIREFWDVNTLTFDWDKFFEFAQRVNVSGSDKDKKRIKPIREVGKEVMPFVAQVQHLRERLLAKELAPPANRLNH